MRKAKKVEIPENHTVKQEEYTKLYKHAKTSALWYVTNYNKNSQQIKQKLYDKGYPKTPLKIIKKDQTTTQENIVEKIIEYLEKYGYINDEDYVKNTLDNQLRTGKSITQAKTKLFQSGLNKEFYEPIIEKEIKQQNTTYNETESLDKAANKITNKTSFKKLNSFKAQQKLVQNLATKGFPFEQIYEWIENNQEIFEENNN